MHPISTIATLRKIDNGRNKNPEYPSSNLLIQRFVKFMKFIIIFLVAALFFTLSHASLAKECGSAYYIPFDALLYAPENEKSIAERAFYKKTITNEKFSEIIISSFTTDHAGYMKHDTRAVIFISGTTYFVDANGIIRRDEKYSIIEISKFEAALSEKCPTFADSK